MNLGSLNTQYEIAGFKAVQIYPYFTQKTKRYFRGYRQQQVNQFYRIIVYSCELVESEGLITFLKQYKDITHPFLGKIKYLFQETYLYHGQFKSHIEPAIAVVFEDRLETNFISFYQYLIELGNLTERISKNLIFKILKFISYMEGQHLPRIFNSHDLYINKQNGDLRIDNYGDRKYFKVQDAFISNSWEIGALFFTCIKGIPPYNSKSQSDLHFTALKNGQFNKFWKMIKQKPSAEIQKFIQLCFTKNTEIKNLEENSLFQHYQQIPKQIINAEIASIIQEKNLKEASAVQKRRQRRQKIHKCLRERNSLAVNRTSVINDELIEIFLDNLQRLESHPRKLLESQSSQQQKHQQQINQKIQQQNIEIAHLITLLNLNLDEDIKIHNIVDNNNQISFQIQAHLGDNIEIDSRVIMNFINGEKCLLFNYQLIEGSLFESMWIRNYIGQLLSEV